MGRRPPSSGLPPAVDDAERFDLERPSGRVTCYHADARGPPVLLVHSINAAASAYEVRPIFDGLRGRYALFAPDLPGFGLSDRSEGVYDVDRFVDAIDGVLDAIEARRPGEPVHALALSLGSELLARVIRARPERFASAAFVSPTGFESGRGRTGRPEDTREMPTVSKVLGVVGKPLFDLLTTEVSIRFFLKKTFGLRDIDEGLFEYAVLTANQPGARHAPLAFVSGRLFSKNPCGIYEGLELPAWVAHGVRGDFVDFGGLAWTRALDHWQVQVYESGALPHFEDPDRFVADYEAFLSRPARKEGP